MDVRSANDSATAPSDFTHVTPRLTFLAGETSKAVVVKVRGDTLPEPGERFFMNLSNPENSTIARSQGIGTIRDDDSVRGGRAPTPPPGPPTTPPGTDPPGRDAGCLNFRAGISARRLGPARLGMARKRQRAIFKGAKLSSRAGIDRSCVAGGGSLRIGYPTARLLRGLSRSERRRVKDRAVLVLTSSRRYSIRGIKPGESVRTLRRKLRGERAYRVGGSSWYLASSAGGRLIFRIRSGRVAEIGIADRRLTGTPRSARRLLGAWRL